MLRLIAFYAEVLQGNSSIVECDPGRSDCATPSVSGGLPNREGQCVSSLVVRVSLLIDTVETRSVKAKDALGGTARSILLWPRGFVYRRAVGPGDDDLPTSAVEMLQNHNVDLSRLKRRHRRPSAGWASTTSSMNVAHTLDTPSSTCGNLSSRAPFGRCRGPVLFLGNIDPRTSAVVLKRVRSPQLIALDTT